jgi:hypothetical protein
MKFEEKLLLGPNNSSKRKLFIEEAATLLVGIDR